MGKMSSSPLVPAGRDAGPCEGVGKVRDNIYVQQLSSRPHDNLGFTSQHFPVSFCFHRLFQVSGFFLPCAREGRCSDDGCGVLSEEQKF